ncbi:unnamed protein product, partial [Anisakis simplex]|uniref:MFS domain-containing protein n=1 Tax=Anisakis simplex TaxID=6269 RepID=A0A0M3JSD9_ANISI
VKVLVIPEFLIHLVAVFFAASLCISYYIFEIPLMVERDIDRDTAAYVFSSQGIASIVGRITATFIIRITSLHIGLMMLMCYGIAQGSIFSAIFCTNYPQCSFKENNEPKFQFIAQNILSGFGVGMYSVSLTPFLLHISGPEQLPTAFGYTNLINGLAGFVSMFIGKLADRYGVVMAFGVAAYFGIASIIACFIAIMLMLWKERNKEQRNERELVAVTDDVDVNLAQNPSNNEDV